MKKKWEKIVAAKELLGVANHASQQQIKQAYRRLSKKYHPDMAQEMNDVSADKAEMQRLTEAYKILMSHCENFLVPLVPGEDATTPEGEDWWMDRFGQDPLWGPGRD